MWDLESLQTPLVPERHKSSFLMKLFFFAYLTPEQRKAIVIEHLNSVRQMRSQLEAVRPEVVVRADKFQLLCFEFGLRMSQDLTQNLSVVVKELENLDGKESQSAE